MRILRGITLFLVFVEGGISEAIFRVPVDALRAVLELLYLSGVHRRPRLGSLHVSFFSSAGEQNRNFPKRTMTKKMRGRNSPGCQTLRWRWRCSSGWVETRWLQAENIMKIF